MYLALSLVGVNTGPVKNEVGLFLFPLETRIKVGIKAHTKLSEGTVVYSDSKI